VEFIGQFTLIDVGLPLLSMQMILPPPLHVPVVIEVMLHPPPPFALGVCHCEFPKLSVAVSTLPTAGDPDVTFRVLTTAGPEVMSPKAAEPIV
jgi:hypothetical protein